MGERGRGSVQPTPFVFTSAPLASCKGILPKEIPSLSQAQDPQPCQRRKKRDALPLVPLLSCLVESGTPPRLLGRQRPQHAHLVPRLAVHCAPVSVPTRVANAHAVLVKEERCQLPKRPGRPPSCVDPRVGSAVGGSRACAQRIDSNLATAGSPFLFSTQPPSLGVAQQATDAGWH